MPNRLPTDLRYPPITWTDATRTLPPRGQIPPWKRVRVLYKGWCKIGKKGKKLVCMVKKSRSREVMIRPWRPVVKHGRKNARMRTGNYETLEEAKQKAEELAYMYMVKEGLLESKKRRHGNPIPTTYVPLAEFAALCGATEETILTAINNNYIMAAQDGERILIRYNFPTRTFVKRLRENDGVIPSNLKRMGRVGLRVKVVNRIEIYRDDDYYYGYTPDGKCLALGRDFEKAKQECFDNVEYIQRAPYRSELGKAVSLTVSYHDIRLLLERIPATGKFAVLRRKVEDAHKRSVESRNQSRPDGDTRTARTMQKKEENSRNTTT